MKSRRSAVRARRGGVIWPILFSLALILGGIEALALGLVRQQEAARLAAAPVCASGQLAGCRLRERVTVLDAYIEDRGRYGGTSREVKVRTPDGKSQIVTANSYDVGLWSTLYVTEQLNAELWNGSVIRLDDAAGRYLLADDSPAVTSVLFPIIGALAVIAGGIILGYFVRRLSRQKHTNR